MTKQPKKKLILASASPRRLGLLRQIGIEPEVFPVDAEELKTGVPEEVVEENAVRKAQTAATLRPQNTILAADTIVAYHGKILGKPQTETEAADMLKMLSGQKHSVFTGIAAIENGILKSSVIESQVYFFQLTEAAIHGYIATGEPMDKAGAYGIQGRGALLVRAIAGDYNNIVGLPLAALKNIMTIGDYINW